jgi:hypothetical protein
MPIFFGRGHIPGTLTNDSAAAGAVGEFLTNSGSTALTSTVAANITTLSLTPGDWDVWGTVETVATSSLTSVRASTSNSSATLSASGGLIGPLAGISGGNLRVQVGLARFSVSVTTTVYLVTNQEFVGTNTSTGSIFARRAR